MSQNGFVTRTKRIPSLHPQFCQTLGRTNYDGFKIFISLKIIQINQLRKSNDYRPGEKFKINRKKYREIAANFQLHAAEIIIVQQFYPRNPCPTDVRCKLHKMIQYVWCGMYVSTPEYPYVVYTQWCSTCGMASE